MDRFKRDWQVNHQTVTDGNTAWLTVGEYHWQLPIPAVKTDKGWQFDMQEAKEEILNREVGRNELAAIEALHAYVDAQDSYYALNTHYARKIVSSEGKKMACTGPLSWRSAQPARPGLQPERARSGLPRLSLPHPAGQQIRLRDDRPPVSYGETGVMSFMINGDDRVWQSNLGEKSAEEACAMPAFNPDDRWQLVAQ